MPSRSFASTLLGALLVLSATAGCSSSGSGSTGGLDAADDSSAGGDVTLDGPGDGGGPGADTTPNDGAPLTDATGPDDALPGDGASDAASDATVDSETSTLDAAADSAEDAPADAASDTAYDAPAEASDAANDVQESCSSCTLNAHQCSSSGVVQTCISGPAGCNAWKDTAACAFGCGSGACATVIACTAGARSCAASVPETCNGWGSAYLAAPFTCPAGCSAGLCTGACNPGAKRCNGSNLETCGSGGTWSVSTACSGSCDAPSATCAGTSLTITTAIHLEGTQVFTGTVDVMSGGSITSLTGNLTLRAAAITVEVGGSIVVAPVGDAATGRGLDGTGSGGGYGTAGAGSSPGGVFGSATDPGVSVGGRGGSGASAGGAGGLGGGVLQLVASTIVIQGQVLANGQAGAASGTGGGGGGGSGGGVLLAANALTLPGTVSASGGAGGSGTAAGGAGGLGRLKLLYGASHGLTLGTYTGVQTAGLLPPLTITSPSHPDPSVIYNDGAPYVAFTWERPFPSAAAYYEVLDTVAATVPNAATGVGCTSELVSLSSSALAQGTNFFHLVPLDGYATLGTVQNSFSVQINKTPVSLSSSSHPSPSSWYPAATVSLSWAFPTPDADNLGAYYVIDHLGRTIPTAAAATFVPVSTQQLLAALADGVWGVHFVGVDLQGYPTTQTRNFHVRVGADPGTGSIQGTVVDGSASPVSGATVTINDGLYNPEIPDSVTGGTGAYTFASVPVGTWDVGVSKTGFSTAHVMVSVTSGAAATGNATLTP